MRKKGDAAKAAPRPCRRNRDRGWMVIAAHASSCIPRKERTGGVCARSAPDLSSVNVEAAGEAPAGAEAQPPAPEAPAAEAPATEAPADVAAQPTPEAGIALPEPTPTPAESVSTSLFPTPTPAPISLLPPAPEGG